MKRVSDIEKAAHMPLDERASAFQKSIVFMRQAYPNMALMTYDDRIHRGADHIILGKFVIGFGKEEPTWINFDNTLDETTCDNVPSGLEGTAYLEDGDIIKTGIYPLLLGTDSNAIEGGAIIIIESQKNDLWLRFGAGHMSFMHYSPNKDMKGDKIDCEGSSCKIADDCVFIEKEDRDIILSARGDLDFKVYDKDKGQYVEGRANKKRIELLLTFSKDLSRLKELTELDINQELKKAKDYYANILDTKYIKTPFKDLDEAFSHALLNVEYSYFYPYGWIESIQHWPTMWHMEHTAFEEYCGNWQRAKDTLRSQMANVFESGAIPDMCTTGKGRRDWGGNNHFFVREVYHYLQMTNDYEFAKEAEAYLDKAIIQTFSEYDPIREGIIAWGTQIGNQEDFESTPGSGAATGSVGAEMLYTLSKIKEFLNKEEEAKSYMDLCQYVVNKMRDNLWLLDLGRYGWYRDILGNMHYETTYHGIAYPVINEQIDDMDMVSSLDHLKNRLSGPEGEVYQTNHFGDHAYDFVPTWGMQCGSNMQAFATKAYAKAGMRDEAVKPLHFIAKRVCGDYQRGSWPETANEKRFAYFSPSAAVFGQEIIESIFGLSINLIENKTKIRPCIPKEEGDYTLKLPDIYLCYKEEGESINIKVDIKNKTDKELTLILPPAKNIKAFVDGKEVAFELKTACPLFEVTIGLGNKNKYDVNLSYEPINLELEVPTCLSVGEAFSLKLQGGQLLGYTDRASLFEEVEYSSEGIDFILKDSLLDDYMKFGSFGQVNFARRTFFVRIASFGYVFDYPIHIVLMPKFFIRARAKGPDLSLELANNTNKDYSLQARLIIDKHVFTRQVDIKKKMKSNINFFIGQAYDSLSPGKNKARLIMGIESFDFEFNLEKESIDLVRFEVDEDLLKEKDYWRDIGLHKSHGHMMQGPDNFMDGLFEGDRIVELIKGHPMKIYKGFIPLSFEKHRIQKLSLEHFKAKKVYVLLSSFLDNHNVFSSPFTIELELEKEDAFISPIYKKVLSYPGDLDMGFGNSVIAGFATFVNGTDRDFLLETPMNDYQDSRPPVYPKRELWSNSKSIELNNTVFNLIELDLMSKRKLKEIRFIANNPETSLGIFAIYFHV